MQPFSKAFVSTLEGSVYNEKGLFPLEPFHLEYDLMQRNLDGHHVGFVLRYPMQENFLQPTF